MTFLGTCQVVKKLKKITAQIIVCMHCSYIKQVIHLRFLNFSWRISFYDRQTEQRSDAKTGDNY